MDNQNSKPIKSILDIARIAGVSASTVSRALSGKGALNKTTRERVRAVARSYGFQLNVSAQNLRLGRTGAIAVLLPLGHERGQHLSDPFFTAMVGFLADTLADRGYDLLLSRVFPADDDWLESFTQSGRADGIIIIGQSDQTFVLDRVAKNYAPLIVWGAYDGAHQHITIGTDNIAGGELAARHLIARGRRKLAYFGNVLVPEFSARYAGFVRALPANLKAAHQSIPVHITPESSYDSALAFFSAGNRPDGIFAASDIVAISVIRAAIDSGIAVPGDLSVVGFDDIALAAHSNPPITTIRQHVERGSVMMCDMLLRKMAGDETPSVQLAPELIVRGSS